MAVTWDVDITMLDLPLSRVQVVATRTDDASDPPDIWTHTIDTLVDANLKPLSVIRQETVDLLWGLYQADVAQQAQEDATLDGWEAAIESDLTAKETP